MQTGKAESLKSQIGILKKAANGKLGEGYWGLKSEGGHKFTHEEIVFLFARIFQALDFEAIVSIQAPFPDCTAIKNKQIKYIEFERIFLALITKLKNGVN